jgi:hypothetical protein
MAETTSRTGRCLCGGVSFTADIVEPHVSSCHCSMCRRWAGGVLLAIDCANGVDFHGAENITRYRSSDWAERAFCNICGSSLFYRLIEQDLTIMVADAFDLQDDFKLTGQVFIDEKPTYYDFANDTKNMTGEEVFGMFAPPSEE